MKSNTNINKKNCNCRNKDNCSLVFNWMHRLWSYSAHKKSNQHLRLVCLSVFSIWLVGNICRKSKICKRTHEANKKVAWPVVQLFCWQFSLGLLFLRRSSCLWACLKAESYTEVEKSACSKLTFMLLLKYVWLILKQFEN